MCEKRIEMSELQNVSVSMVRLQIGVNVLDEVSYYTLQCSEKLEIFNVMVSLRRYRSSISYIAL